MLWPSKFTSAVGNCRGKRRFNSNHLSKKNCRGDNSEQNLCSVYNFQYLFLDKIFVYGQEILFACAREVSVCAAKSQIYYIFSAVYSPFLFVLRGSGTSFAFTSYIILSAKFYDVTLRQLLFCLILLLFVHLPAPIKDL